MVVEIALYCAEHNMSCNLAKEMALFLLNTPIVYSCTVNKLGLPFIRPIMFNYEMENCLFSFLTEKNSQEAKNLRNNNNISFTTESNSPTNPFENSGVMITAYGEISSDEEELKLVRHNLLKKYSSHLAPEIVDYYSTDNDIVVKGFIKKISYWKGPKFKQFECKGRI